MALDDINKAIQFSNSQGKTAVQVIFSLLLLLPLYDHFFVSQYFDHNNFTY